VPNDDNDDDDEHGEAVFYVVYFCVLVYNYLQFLVVKV
jgi:hypothetical protein